MVMPPRAEITPAVGGRAGGGLGLRSRNAAWAFLERLAAYLLSQVEQGFISRAEADLLAVEMQNRLFGLGDWQGAPESVFELPFGIRNTVQRWMEQQSEAEQRHILQEEQRLIQEKEEELMQIQEVAQQRAMLPLGVQGDTAQQIAAGQRAIRELNNQMGFAPDYLKSTIQDQISQLQEGVEDLREASKLRAAEATRARKPENLLTSIASQMGMGRRELQIEFALPENLSRIKGRQRQQILEMMEGGSPVWEPRGEVQRIAEERRERIPFEPPEEVEVGGPPAWQRWFDANYPSIARKFRRLPAAERGGKAGKKRWTDILKRETEKEREEFERTRRDESGFRAPRIRTVEF